MKRHVFQLGLLLTALAVLALPGSVHAQERPFRAMGSGYVSEVDEDGFTAVWSGQATHLGRYDAIAEIAFQPDGSNLGTATLTGANGDSVTMTLHDVFDPVTETFVGEYVITGGTGRFAGASGSGSYVVIPDHSGDVITFDIAFEGTLRY
jgi:hypothetical protein